MRRRIELRDAAAGAMTDVGKREASVKSRGGDAGKLGGICLNLVHEVQRGCPYKIRHSHVLYVFTGAVPDPAAVIRHDSDLQEAASASHNCRARYQVQSGPATPAAE